MAHGASVQYLGPDGEVVRTETIDRSEHKIYRGTAWLEQRDGSWSDAGWARINVRRDGPKPLFDGAFSVMHNTHHLQLHSNYLQTKHESDPHAVGGDDEYMILWRDSDVQKKLAHVDLKRRDTSLSCSADRLDFNRDLQHPVFQAMLKRDTISWGSTSLSSLFGKRQIDSSGIPSGGNSGAANLKSTIGNTQGCPSTRKVALIGVATDCSYTGSFNSSESARENVLTQINSASGVYEKTFNISLGLQNLTVSDPNCPGSPPTATPWNIGCGGNSTITDRLNTFSQWRGQFKDNNAYWTLLTKCNTGAEVGLAWLGQLCVTDITSGSGQSTSGANVVARTSTEWQVIAHESGHTFGAVHDCDSQTCADSATVNAQQCCPVSTTSCDAGGQFLMNPSTGDGITGFSACTIGNICSALNRNSVKQTCLQDNSKIPKLVTGQSCGNGIVEEGEDCDCGGPTDCADNQCCDPKTCKFKNSAVCDDSNEDCCQNCQFATNGTVCRASTGTCDPEETCPGNSAACPADKTAPNGQDCGNGLQCASGQCTSRDLQCRTLMGSFTKNNDTYACNSQDCMLSCASPEFPANECYSMQQNFLSGTPCSGGGYCDNGVCQGSNVGTEISSWIQDHKPIVIGVASAVGGILVLSILSCIVRRCRQSRVPKRVKAGRPPMQQQWPGTSGAWSGGWQQPQPQPQHQPPPITQHYQGYGYGGGSVRYA